MLSRNWVNGSLGPSTFDSTPRSFKICTILPAIGSSLSTRTDFSAGGFSVAPFPGRTTLATNRPIVMATRVFSTSRPISRPATRPLISEVISTRTTANRISGGARAPSNRKINRLGVARKPAHSPSTTPASAPRISAKTIRM